MKAVILKQSDVTGALELLPGWSISDEGRSIARDFAFAGFRQAFAFMAEVALVAEKMDHHPDWRNVYNRVSVSLSTHSAGGVTALDIEMATAMDVIARRFGL